MFDCVIVMAGIGKRAKLGYNKAYLKINGKELFLYSVDTFSKIEECRKIILVCNIDDAGMLKDIIKKYNYPLEIVIGGARRQDSVLEGVKAAECEDVLIHDAARPFVLKEDILKLYNSLKENNTWATLASPVKNTIKEYKEQIVTLNRDKLYSISTPQAVRKSEYIEYASILNHLDLVDDMQPYELIKKESPQIIIESNNNFKITDESDIAYAKYLLEGNSNMDIKTGLGYDIHRLEKGRRLILCAEPIDYEYGLVGHSDADVVLHAIMNAILGALGKGDIGEHFPDNDPKYKDIDSKILFKKVIEMLDEDGYKVSNLDVSIICQRPKLLKYKAKMKKNLSDLLNISEDKINIKANTNEGMDAIGKGLAIASLANVLIYR